MDSEAIQIIIRRPPAPGRTLFLLGPGGVGKSTLGRELARRLAMPLIDLDLEFCERLQLIGPFIAAHGYERYRAANLALAGKLIVSLSAPCVFVTSSGFLAARHDSADYAAARDMIATGYGITLLPSLDLEVATSIVVARQLGRGFGLEQASEERKFRERFQIYRQTGDMLVIAAGSPASTADTLASRLSR